MVIPSLFVHPFVHWARLPCAATWISGTGVRRRLRTLDLAHVQPHFVPHTPHSGPNLTTTPRPHPQLWPRLLPTSRRSF